jgi:hypothetical protein
MSKKMEWSFSNVSSKKLFLRSHLTMIYYKESLLKGIFSHDFYKELLWKGEIWIFHGHKKIHQ